ncbi:MAG: cytidine deaminase [Sphingobacteriales bacterium]|nr:cytidine deaminase [Sphingobacteriales bacterium]
MKKQSYEFEYEIYDDISQLAEADAALLTSARAVTGQAYAPYSRFNVGAAARLENGETVLGTNQENASYPVGICAERVLLGTAATQYPDIAISAMAISFNTSKEKSNHPISPCGMCRQSLLEYETRFKKPIRLIMGGMEGRVYIVQAARQLLPFAFTGDELMK